MKETTAKYRISWDRTMERLMAYEDMEYARKRKALREGALTRIFKDRKIGAGSGN